MVKRRVAVIGSRDYRPLTDVRLLVYSLPPDTTIISGGARGVDEIAERAARECGLDVVVIRPDYSVYPVSQRSRAPLVRNHKIVEQADEVIAFWDGQSSGTAYTIRIARQSGKKVTVHRPGEKDASTNTDDTE